MKPIELHILVGSTAGRRLLLEQPTITIGRSADNDVTLDLPYVSRRHAELRFEQDQWWLINHSDNGTRLNRRWVTDHEPRPIEGPTRINIGDETVLELAPQAGPVIAEGEQSTAEVQAAGERPGGGLSRRAKIWIGIGAYLAVMFALFIIIAIAIDTGNTTQQNLAPELTPEAISREIRQDPQPQPPDERRARAALTEARELFNRRESEPSARYQAMQRYRTALAYMPDHELPDSIDRRRYEVLQDELTDIVTARYQRAYTLLRSERYGEALEAFRSLLNIYPATGDSHIVNNIERHGETARRRARQR